MHRLLVDHLCAEVAERQVAEAGAEKDAGGLRGSLDETTRERWFPHGLKLEAPT